MCKTPFLPPGRYCAKNASECASATITSPVCSPKGLSGAVTSRRIARTVSPAWPSREPFEQLAASVPWLSQNCSLRITKPMPGNSMTVLGGGVAVTGVPCTTRPTSWVPLALDEAPNEFAALLDCDLTTWALIPHPVGDDRRQTPLA